MRSSSIASLPAQTWRRNSASTIFEASTSRASARRSLAGSFEMSALISVGANRAAMVCNVAASGTEASCARRNAAAAVHVTTNTPPAVNLLIVGVIDNSNRFHRLVYNRGGKTVSRPLRSCLDRDLDDLAELHRRAVQGCRFVTPGSGCRYGPAVVVGADRADHDGRFDGTGFVDHYFELAEARHLHRAGKHRQRLIQRAGRHDVRVTGAVDANRGAVDAVGDRGGGHGFGGRGGRSGRRRRWRWRGGFRA